MLFIRVLQGIISISCYASKGMNMCVRLYRRPPQQSFNSVYATWRNFYAQRQHPCIHILGSVDPNQMTPSSGMQQ